MYDDFGNFIGEQTPEQKTAMRKQSMFNLARALRPYTDAVAVEDVLADAKKIEAFIYSDQQVGG